MKKQNIISPESEIIKGKAYQHLICVDWLSVIARLSGIEISSKPIRELEKEYFHKEDNEVDYKELERKFIATEHSILNKLPNEEGLAAINPTCFTREEYFSLDDGLYKAKVEAYKVAKLEKCEIKTDNLSYDDTYISNGLITIRFDDNGQIKKVETKNSGEINLPFNHIMFKSKNMLLGSYKTSKYKHVSSSTSIQDGIYLVREDVYDHKLDSLVQQISIKLDSNEIEFKTRVVINHNSSSASIEFKSEKEFESIADNWPGYERLFIGREGELEYSVFSINAKKQNDLVLFETNGKGKYTWDFCVHIDEVQWGDSNLAEVYQSRSMPLILTDMSPKIRQIIELDNLGVLVTKLRLSSNGKYVLVALKEMYNQECECAIKAGFRAKGVYEIDKDHALMAVTSSMMKFKPNEEIDLAFEL